MIDETEKIGYEIIDLGPGTDGYKRHYATHPRYVRSGLVTLPTTSGRLAKTYNRLESALKMRTGDALGKLRRRYSQIAACESSRSKRFLALISAVLTTLKRKTA
jgi:CelD/BcsL family acetyltransferase involved in cellulose biosynthesis